jgi:hypothetical protein
MATGQTILNLMEVLHPELQLQSGESDVAKGLVAANAAQDMFETHAAQYCDFWGSSTGTVDTTSGQEFTDFPTGLIRLDGLDYINPTTNRPGHSLRPLFERGQHAAGNFWPNSLVSSQSSGVPRAYWTNGTRIYWDPIPSGTDTIRYYGFSHDTDITASGTIRYPEAVSLPLATLAVKIIRLGLDDPIGELTQFVADTFNPVLDLLSGFRRDGPAPYAYSRHHEA